MKSRIIKMPVQAKASIAFVSASLLSQGLVFITMPIFTRLLSTTDMGYVTTYNAWQTMLGAVVGLSLASGSFNIAMMKFANERNEYESSVLTLSFIPATLFLVIAVIFGDSLAVVLGLSEHLLILMAVVLFFSPAFNFWIMRQRYEYKYRSVFAVTLCNSVVGTLLSVVLVLNASATGGMEPSFARLLPVGITLSAFGALFSVVILRRGRTMFDEKYWRFALITSLPMMIQALSKHVLDVSDRVMIGAILGESYVGIYGVLYSVSSISLVFWSAINSSMIPYMFEKLKCGDLASARSVASKVVVCYAVVCLLLTILAPEIVALLATSEYESATYLMPPIAAGIYFTCLHSLYSNLIMYKEKTIYVMIATTLAALLNIGLNFCLIPRFGFVAAAYATLISYVALAALQYCFSRVVGQRNVLNDREIFFLSVVFVVLCLLINLIYPYRFARVAIVVIAILAGVLFRKRIIEFLRQHK